MRCMHEKKNVLSNRPKTGVMWTGSRNCAFFLMNKDYLCSSYINKDYHHHIYYRIDASHGNSRQMALLTLVCERSALATIIVSRRVVM